MNLLLNLSYHAIAESDSPPPTFAERDEISKSANKEANMYLPPTYIPCESRPPVSLHRVL